MNISWNAPINFSVLFNSDRRISILFLQELTPTWMETGNTILDT